ncbi:MAG: RagB/SusD family nutrient uptake outer membrane protein [Bacteroidota bacterium]|nr:RagB/SusD family nutrient uptake outer membrane protein [Bacteroidota bacterium]
MKKVTKKFYLYSTLIILSTSLFSCVNDLNVTPIDPSINQQFNQSEVFAKIYAGFQLTGLQGPTGNPDVSASDEGNFGMYRAYWNMNELGTDEACWPYEANPGILGIQTNSPNSSNAFIQNFYEYAFIEITMCNSFLEQTAGKTDDATIKERAEIRFLRALHYYNLMDFFGNVPFATTVSTTLPKQILRADLFNWIRSELMAIQPNMYQDRTHDYFRLDVVADWLLLSRMYLNAKVYTGTAKYDSAAIYSKKVIDSNYKLATKYRYLFMGDNAGAVAGSAINDAPNELIFPVAANGKKIASFAGSCYLVASSAFSDMTDSVVSNFLPNSRWGCNRAKVSLTKKFFPSGTLPSGISLIDLRTAAGDERAMLYANNRPVQIKDRTDPKQGLAVFKFTNGRADGLNKKDSDLTMPDMSIPIMRMAEAYLTYAEAVTRGASPIGSYTALQAVNALRTRANASTLSSLALTDILDEWSREFYFEGRRRIDLIRYGYFGGANDYTWDWKGGTLTGSPFSGNYNIYPLPQTDLSANSNLKQNTGY